MVQPISEMRQSGLLPPEEPPVSDMTTSAYDLAQEQIFLMNYRQKNLALKSCITI